MRRPAATLQPRRAIAAAEMAVVMPFVVLMFVGAVDFCRVFRDAQIVQSSAQSGSFYASGTARRNAETSAEEAAREAALREGASLRPPLKAEQIAVTFTSTTATVTVSYPYRTFVRYPGLPHDM